MKYFMTMLGRSTVMMWAALAVTGVLAFTSVVLGVLNSQRIAALHAESGFAEPPTHEPVVPVPREFERAWVSPKDLRFDPGGRAYLPAASLETTTRDKVMEVFRYPHINAGWVAMYSPYVFDFKNMQLEPGNENGYFPVQIMTLTCEQYKSANKVIHGDCATVYPRGTLPPFARTPTVLDKAKTR
jgi:hypothetical protein